MTASMPTATDEKAKQRERRNATRAALIEAAMRLFHDRGYGPTTAEDIATAIGQTKGAFYFHFESKADCFLAVLAHRQQMRGDWYLIPRQFSPDTHDLEHVVGAAMLDLAERMEGMPAFGLAMVDFWLTTERTEAIEEEFRTIHGNWIREIASFFDECRVGGWVDPALDTEAAARQAHALVDGDSTQRRIYGTDVTDLIIKGVAKLLQT